MTDEGYRELHLTGKQLVFIFMAGTVVLVVVFLLGVLVGRGVQTDKEGGTASTLVSAPQMVPDSTPAALPDEGQAPAPAEVGAAPAPTPADELSYPTRLETTGAARETLKPAPGSTTGQPATRPSPSPSPSPSPAAGRDASIAPPADSPSSASAKGEFSVQVAAVKKRSEADVIVRRLMNKGFRAYVFAPQGKTPAAVFRVRVGNFKSLKEAEEASRRLEQDGQYKPWIIR